MAKLTVEEIESLLADTELQDVAAERDRLVALVVQLAHALIEDERSPTAAQADALLAYEQERQTNADLAEREAE